MLSRTATATGALVLSLLLPAAVAGEAGWFASLERVHVGPVDRAKTAQLVDAGTIETDGFSEILISIAGEFKEGVPESGTIGAILVPDRDPFLYLLRTEGRIVFPIEVVFDVRGLRDPIFVSPQEQARIGFPRYRAFFYNETSSSAVVSLFAYRSR